ncbi:hypothetical protein BDQ12DRAFT_733611 [Crucibulum laeve]|uniref:poly(ADP-ribose) glycohydrolase n=1 Tax=Crucibulum laeve TaxID=68775 RepID=A0A5C3M7D0_9AGAR|nr:hypothetical protein BDQ12DRAFT_733611 [Crucibulum laeve]
MENAYLLPCHPAITSLDPLGVSEIEEPTAWDVITASISLFRSERHTDLHRLPSLIEDLAYSLHHKGSVNTAFLQHFLTDSYPDARADNALNLLDAILHSALALPTVFPTREIPYLNLKNPHLHLTDAQVKSLIAHQILGTVKPPKGNAWGCSFLCWYSSPQPMDSAVRGYLETLFHYMSCISDNNHSTTYEFYSAPIFKQGEYPWQISIARVFDYLEIDSTEASSVEFPHKSLKYMLIASNVSPGFGASCTQEELVTAACPALLPLGALCVAPPIPSDAALLTHGIIPVSTWKGQGRHACRTGMSIQCSAHGFLLVDATELDTSESSSLADLIPKNLERDLLKVYTGFAAVRRCAATEIASPLWGAGAFGGDPIVKSLILAIAAASAGVKIHLSVDKQRQIGHESMSLFKTLTDMKSCCSSVQVNNVWRLLNHDRVRSCRDGSSIAEILCSADF